MAFGFSADHVLEPDVAFSAADRDTVPMSLRLATAYRSLLSNLAVEWTTRRDAAGGRDHLIALGVERWLARFLLGDFGLRGAFSTGTRDRRQLSAGLSHRTKLLQIDYAFGLPFGGVAGTAGTHRLGLSLRFGRATERDESVEMIMEAMQRLRAPAAPQAVLAAKDLSPTQKAVAGEFLAQSRGLLAEGHYKDALAKMTQALSAAPADAGLIQAFGRLNQIAGLLPGLENISSDAAQAAQHQGVLAYAGGDDAAAMASFSRALSFKPQDPTLRDFVTQMERATGIARSLDTKPEPRRVKLADLGARRRRAFGQGLPQSRGLGAREAAACRQRGGLTTSAAASVRDLGESSGLAQGLGAGKRPRAPRAHRKRA